MIVNVLIGISICSTSIESIFPVSIVTIVVVGYERTERDEQFVSAVFCDGAGVHGQVQLRPGGVLAEREPRERAQAQRRRVHLRLRPHGRGQCSHVTRQCGVTRRGVACR